MRKSWIAAGVAVLLTAGVGVAPVAASVSDSGTVTVAAKKVVKKAGKWKTIPTTAGTYRVEASCPAGTRPAGGTVVFQELTDGGNGKTARGKEYVDIPAGYFPERYLGGSIGETAESRVYAELVLAKGPELRARAIAHCR